MPAMRPALVLAFLFLLASCSDVSPATKLTGKIFGTTWNLTYYGAPAAVDAQDVESAVLSAFAVVDESMNHYLPESTLSQLNTLPAGEAFEVDWDFTLVFNTALDIHYASDGAYDPTVSPIIDLWGFGPEGVSQRPSRNQLVAAERHVGLGQFAWDLSTRTFVKRQREAKIDFSSIAKGYAVDLAADELDVLEIANFMLEVGGEVQVRGSSPRGDLWRLAIENPEKSVGSAVYTALTVSDVGVATSGDYRNFFEENGKRYSHLIDPRTSLPIEHDLVSATVVHPSTMIADAWATALMVVGTREALRLADIYGLSVYLISREGDQLVSSHNSAMAKWLGPSSQRTDDK